MREWRLSQQPCSSARRPHNPLHTSDRPARASPERLSASSTDSGGAPCGGAIARKAGSSSSSARASSLRMAAAAVATSSSSMNRRTFSDAWSQSACALESCWRSFSNLCASRARSSWRPEVNRKMRSLGTTSASNSRSAVRREGCSLTDPRAAMQAPTMPRFWSNFSCTRSYFWRKSDIDRLHEDWWLVRLSRTACAASRCTCARASARPARATAGRASSMLLRASRMSLLNASKAGSSESKGCSDTIP
mmetsp:Transcript_61270/g.159014  ORF Transcript_61270/g.159014 Transcript_61270/m.159014 type:complete len:249 (+) Transcript_61270:678-1424(+)